MIIIGDTLISEELVTSRFRCNLRHCSGQCCVEGDAGAPLEKSEIEEIAAGLNEIKPFMEEKGLASLRTENFYTRDLFGGLVTSLNEGKECLFTVFKNGIAFCAIEKAWEAGKITFQKPISCHLYPVRISKYDDFEAVNVHRWHVCASAWADESTELLYQYLKAPLIRKYGAEWYDQLEAAVKFMNDSGK